MAYGGGKHNSAFTLIEILVVITIIAVLAATLFPVLAQAKSSAKKTVCTSNLRQLTFAYAMYANDNDDTLCPPVILSNLTVYPWHAWFGELDSPTSQLDPSKALLAPYLKNTRLFDCPEIAKIPNALSEDLSYGINDQLCITTVNLNNLDVTCHTITASQVQIPAETLLFADAAQNDPGPKVDKRAILQFNGHFTGDSRGFVHARHIGNVANVAWLDGHAGAVHLSYNTRNDSSRYTAAWEQQEGLGDVLKFPRQYAYSVSTAPSIRDMYYYLTDKSVDPTVNLNTLTNWLLL